MKLIKYLNSGHVFQQFSVRVLLQPIYSGELSELFTLLSSLAPEKQGKNKEN